MNQFLKEELLIEWTQIDIFRREYLLKAGNQPLGQVNFQHWYSNTANAYLEERNWVFKPEGFWNQRILVSQEGQPATVATLESKSSFSRSTLHLPSGECYQFASENFSQTRWSWKNASGQPLVYFHYQQWRFNTSAWIQVTPLGQQSPILPLLLSLGWYALIRYLDMIVMVIMIINMSVAFNSWQLLH